ncbi:conjugal transfer protein TraG N-terminal domain-containing protein [Alteromonas gracilis]|uniref:conjugal transfer protein TraG N-terminal domain-containing protein n=1 Tax=Alteromonas gracilis TaxID=1479524 RepID=UPI003735199A
MNQTVEFFTTGDPYLIETVLNAVMMALDAGGLGGGNAIGGAMAIGILVSAINALTTGEFSFNKLIAAFVVWFTMFGFSMGSAAGTRYDAVITGPNGSTAFVTDLPLGIAMPFYVLGIVGPEMNDVLTTAFALPKYVPAGDGSPDSVRIPSDPYVALMNLRQWSPTQQTLQNDRDDLAASMVNYVRDCYNAHLVSQGRKDEIDSKSFHNFWPSIDTGPIPFTTEVYFELSSPGQALNSGDAPHSRKDPAEVHCDIAHAEIEAQMDSDWVDTAIGDMRISGRVNIDAAVSLTNATVAGSVTAANLVRSEFARYVVRRAATEGTASFSNLELSMEKARFRAMQDKNTKGAADYSYYNENWTIMLQIFEIICYFVTVLIPFLILISGGALLKILLAWLTLVVWVNTIPITAVLSRLFVEYYASLSEMCANPTDVQCLNLQTVGGIEASYTTIETALGMGGTIAQLMPTVTLFLLTGSAYALMGAANSAPKASTDTSNVNPKFGGVVNGDGTVVNSRGLTATLGAETGASMTVTNANGTSGSVSVSNNYNRASNSSGTLSQTTGKEVGKNAVEAVSQLRSTSAGNTSSSADQSEKQQQIQEAQAISSQLSTQEKTAYGDEQTLADKYGEILSSTFAVSAGVQGSVGTGSFLGDFANIQAYAGIENREQQQEAYERLSQHLQKIGYSKEDADQLVRQEQFQKTASEMAKTAIENRDTLSVLNDTSRSSIDQFQENSKRADAYQKAQGFLESASSSSEAKLNFENGDYLQRNDAQLENFLEAVQDHGMITQSEQLDILTKGLSNRDDIISDFQQFASQNGYSSASLSERQDMLETFIDGQKQQGADFSQNEKALNKEFDNSRERWSKLVQQNDEATGGLGSLLNPAQQFMLDKTRGIESSIELNGTSGDALELQKYDDKVDMLSEFMTNPNKADFLTGMSENLAKLAGDLANVNEEGSAIETDVDNISGAVRNSDGRLVQNGAVLEQLDEQYGSQSNDVRLSSDANGVRPASQGDIIQAGSKQSSELNELFEKRYGEADRIIDNLENYKPGEDSTYKVNRGNSYEDEAQNYLDSLPINENLELDMKELYGSLTENTFGSRLQNGFDLMGNKELGPDDMTSNELKDLRLAQAYTATQSNPQLSSFNNVLEQLRGLSSEESGLNEIEERSLNNNSKYFTDDGQIPLATAFSNDVETSGRYASDFNTTYDFIMETAKDVETGGFFSNSNINAINAAKGVYDGELRKTFDALQTDGERKDGAGRDTQLLAISAIEMMRNGDATQKQLGENIAYAVRAFDNSGGDYGKFLGLYNSSKDDNFGKGAFNDAPELGQKKSEAPYDFTNQNVQPPVSTPLMPTEDNVAQQGEGKMPSVNGSGNEGLGEFFANTFVSDRRGSTDNEKA